MLNVELGSGLEVGMGNYSFFVVRRSLFAVRYSFLGFRCGGLGYELRIMSSGGLFRILAIKSQL